MSKPLYDSKDFEEFCEVQKAKGLCKKYWSELPQMWAKELDFRKELEEALDVLEKRAKEN